MNFGVHFGLKTEPKTVPIIGPVFAFKEFAKVPDLDAFKMAQARA